MTSSRLDGECKGWETLGAETGLSLCIVRCAWDLVLGVYA